MDKIEAILLNYYIYEITTIPPIKNDKQPTWWPHIVREYDPKKWATSPDPDSFPVDGPSSLNHFGDKDLYDWVTDKIFDKLLTTNDKQVIKAFLSTGKRVDSQKAGKILGCKSYEATKQYGQILLKIKNSLDSHDIDIYFQKVL